MRPTLFGGNFQFLSLLAALATGGVSTFSKCKAGTLLSLGRVRARKDEGIEEKRETVTPELEKKRDMSECDLITSP